MTDLLTFDKENAMHIKAVENSFGASGRSLSKPGRMLMGQGRLMKQGRRRTQPKVFFLFNDVLVYGSIILTGPLYRNQKIIPLEDIELEDMEDGVEMRNQWLIRTPRKSFYVSASSSEQKQAWIDHIQECKSNLLKGSCQQPRSTSDFAVTWIPDLSAYRCMRCFEKFTVTKRRHHCRRCGFLVCNSCSKQREVLHHIDPKEKQRVCKLCYTQLKEGDISRQRWDSTGKNSSEEEDVAASSDETMGNVMFEVYNDSTWMQTWPNA